MAGKNLTGNLLGSRKSVLGFVALSDRVNKTKSAKGENFLFIMTLSMVEFLSLVLKKLL